MTRRIVESSLKFRLLVAVAAAGLIVIGVARLGSTRVDSYPEFNPPYVEVQTEALGLSAAEVEQLITVPLEVDLLNGVAWLDKIRSESLPGLSSIFLLFEPGTNLIRARQMVSERLNQPAALPSVGRPPIMLPPLSSSSRTMMVGLSSEKMSLIDVGVLARWTIKPRLMAVPGVANVTIWGHRERQLQVQADPKRLRDTGVSLDQIVTTTGNSLWVSPLTFLEASTPGAGGFFDAPNQRLQVRHESPIINAADLARVAVDPAEGKPAPKGRDGKPLRLGDVATVVEDHQPLIGDAIVNGKPGIMLVVEKLPTANTLEVTRGVEEALDALTPGLGGLTVDRTIFRPATYINQARHGLATSLLIGFGLMILALALLLYQWRAALVAVVGIVSSLTAAALIFSVSGSTFNMMMLAGLAAGLAIVVDEAVAGAESVARSVAEPGLDARSVAVRVRDAIVQGRRGIGFATVIIALPLLPVLFLTDLGKALGGPLAISFVLALAISTTVALTVTPALGVFVFSAGSVRRESPLLRPMVVRYNAFLYRALRSTRSAIIVFAVLAIAGLAIVPQLKQSPLPTLKEASFLVEVDAAPGTSLTEMQRITTKVGRELAAVPGVRNVSGHAGRATMSDRVVNSNSSELWVTIDSQADYARTVTAIRRTAKSYPGIDTDVTTYSQDRLAEFGTGADEPVVVRLFGADLDVLRKQSATVTSALQGVKGLKNLHAELPRMEPTIHVEVNLEAARVAGIKPGDVRRAATTLLSGVLVGNTFEDQKVFEVVVWGTPNVRQNINTVHDLLIETSDGGYVRLGDIASVGITASPNIVERDAATRFLDVTAGVRGRGRDTVLSDVRSRLASIEFPLEYHYELVGNFAERKALQSRLLVVGLAIAAAVFLLMQAAFGSWRLGTIVFLTTPLALLGGAVAVLIDQATVELGSLVGFLAILGITVRHSVELYKRYQHLERNESVAFGRDLVLRGARERLGPTVATAVATALLFVPFAIRGNMPGHEIVGSMSWVIIGGLITSIVVTLFLLPALYLRFGEGEGQTAELDLRDLWEELPEGESRMTGHSGLVGAEPGPAKP